MVFTREPTSMPGRIAATAADAMAQIARGRPEGGGEDAEAKTSSGGLEVPHDDALNRDMTHQAPSSPVRSTDMVFTRSKNLHAKASGGRHRHPRTRRAHPAGSIVEEEDEATAAPDAGDGATTLGEPQPGQPRRG